MVNPIVKLAPNILDKSKIEMLPTRDGYGKGVVEAGEKDPRVVVLCADLMESTRSHWFKEKFPERYVEVGVAEQNMATVAAGMANYGKIPFIASYAVFSPGRNFEQIRTTVALNNVPVKVMGMHAGISVGPDGATHQALDDIAITRVIPRMVVVVPCDAVEAKKAILAVAFNNQPSYVRFAREKTPVCTTEETPFEIGRAEYFWLPRNEKKVDVAIIACGPLVHNAILAAAELEEKEKLSISVINNHTIKPIDEKTIIEAAKKAGAVVTVEEHQIMGGMGSAVAEVLAQNCPVPMEFIGVRNRFGESGEPDELIEAFGMGVESIREAVKRVLKRK